MPIPEMMMTDSTHMKINNRQRVLLIIATSLIVVTGLFPPWRTTHELSKPAPYSPIWRPPAPSYQGSSFEIDPTRLGIEWLLIVIVSGAIWVLLKTRGD